MNEINLGALYVVYAAVTGKNVGGDLTSSAALQEIREAGANTKQMLAVSRKAAEMYVAAGRVVTESLMGLYVDVLPAAVLLCMDAPDALPYAPEVKAASRVDVNNACEYPLDRTLLHACYGRIALWKNVRNADIFVGSSDPETGFVEYGIRVVFESSSEMFVGAIRRTADAPVEFHS